MKSKSTFLALTFAYIIFGGSPAQASRCQDSLLVEPPSIQSPSDFAKNSLGIQFLAHGTSIANARAAITDGALNSSFERNKAGSFATVGTRKVLLKGIFTQAIFKPELLAQALNYSVSVPFDREDPDAGGTIETRYFEVIFIFDLRPLNDFPLYAAPGWSYDPPIDRYGIDEAKKKHLLESLKSTDVLPVKGQRNLRLVNEVVFNLPDPGLSFKYLIGIHVHRDAAHMLSSQSLLQSDLRQAGWSNEEISKLFNGWRQSPH